MIFRDFLSLVTHYDIAIETAVFKTNTMRLILSFSGNAQGELFDALLSLSTFELKNNMS